MIDESEVGLAVLYSSLNEHCNPNKGKTSENKVEYKIASQTLTDTYYHSNFTTTETQSSGINIISSSGTQDSLMLQFQNKIEDLYIVPETPEANRKRPLETKLKDTQTNKMFTDEPKVKSKKLEDDFDLLKDDFDFKIANSTKISNKLDQNSFDKIEVSNIQIEDTLPKRDTFSSKKYESKIEDSLNSKKHQTKIETINNKKEESKKMMLKLKIQFLNSRPSLFQNKTTLKLKLLNSTLRKKPNLNLNPKIKVGINKILLNRIQFTLNQSHLQSLLFQKIPR